MGNKEFMTEIEVQNAVIVALTGDKVGKSPKGLFRFVKGIEYPAFVEILKKMCDRDEIVSRGTMLVRPQKPVDPEREALKEDILNRTEALLPAPPNPPQTGDSKAPPEVVQQSAYAGNIHADILDFIQASPNPVTHADIAEKSVVKADYTTIHNALHALMNAGKIQRVKQEGSRSFLYSIAPIPKVSCITVTKGKPRVIRETRALLWNEFDVDDEALHGRIAPSMDKEKYWEWVGGHLYDCNACRVDGCTVWQRTGGEELSIYWDELMTDTGKGVWPLPLLLDAAVGTMRREISKIWAFFSEFEDTPLEEVTYCMDAIRTVADKMRNGSTWIRMEEIKHTTWMDMSEAGEIPIMPPWWVSYVLQESLGDIVKVTEQREDAKKRKEQASDDLKKADSRMEEIENSIKAGIASMLEAIKSQSVA